jgi:hypothetical protein
MSEKLKPKGFIQVKGVYPKDIFVELEISLHGINLILDYLDRCVFDPDSQEEKMSEEDIAFVTEDFFKGLDTLTKTVK